MIDAGTKLAESYFAYLARSFPVMCASDEFHFLPRAQAASEYYDRLDCLDSQTIDASIARLKAFRDEIGGFAGQNDHLESKIDRELLRANIAGILIEFEKKRVWQYNPLLYLKIAFIGLDHALNKPAADPAERFERVLLRLAAIPGLFRQGMENIRTIPRAYHQASRSMVADCRQYLHQVGQHLAAAFAGKIAERASTELHRTLAALNAFGGHLRVVPVAPDGRFAAETLNETLKDHFLNRRDVDDIYRMAVENWSENLNQLEKLKLKMGAAASWQELYHQYLPAEIDACDTLTLYRQEIDRLRHFFSRRGFRSADLNQPVEVSDTPLYLRSVRGAASFAAAFTADESEKSYFYITTRLPESGTGQAGALLKKRFHREYKMLAAHETIPGHHFLDSVRCRLKNPVRRQIESPLFYEGWASYAEFLLVENGYVSRPMDLLVDYKRRLWRSARCQVDVGLTTGKINTPDAIHLLEVCGFSTEEAQRQIDRFRLNPGYQLCYSLGCYEFKQLKLSCGRRMPETDFHTFLLEGGELPFHLIKQRFDNYSVIIPPSK